MECRAYAVVPRPAAVQSVGWQVSMELDWAASREKRGPGQQLGSFGPAVVRISLLLLPTRQGGATLAAPLSMKEDNEVGSAATTFILSSCSRRWSWCCLWEQLLLLPCLVAMLCLPTQLPPLAPYPPLFLVAKGALA